MVRIFNTLIDFMILRWFWVQFSTYCLVYHYSQSIWLKQAVSRKDRPLFQFRGKRVERHAEAAVLVIFLLEECTRKKERSTEHSGRSVKEGWWREGMVLYSQFNVSRSRHSQQRCLLTWPECCWCYRGRGKCMLVALHVVFPQRVQPNYRLSVLVNSTQRTEIETYTAEKYPPLKMFF